MDSTQTESLAYESPRPTKEHAVLTVVHHPDRDLLGIRRVLRDEGRALLGRSGQSFFPGAFELRSISREHAEITRRGPRVEVRDLGSHNGTYVNGERQPHAVLNEGDIVGIGDVLLLLHRGPPNYREPDHTQVLGRSWPVRRLLDAIGDVAEDRENLLLVGETGSGKELVARAVHDASSRGGDFVAINCGGVAEGVLQSELFGHVKGAFSGAGNARPGLFEVAAEGTLFLDEIAAAPPALQTSLLRVLETGDYRPVGATRARVCRARVVAALQPTPDPHGGLRPDLWFRLSRRRIDVPPLRERREDVMVLAQHLAAASVGRPVRFSRGLALALLRHDWPGNVRELAAVVEQAARGHGSDEPLEADTWTGRSTAASPGEKPRKRKRKRKPKAKRPAAEELSALLTQQEGSVAEVARHYDVDRKTIYRWAKALGVDVQQAR